MKHIQWLITLLVALSCTALAATTFSACGGGGGTTVEDAAGTSGDDAVDEAISNALAKMAVNAVLKIGLDIDTDDEWADVETALTQCGNGVCDIPDETAARHMHPARHRRQRMMARRSPTIVGATASGTIALPDREPHEACLGNYVCPAYYRYPPVSVTYDTTDVYYLEADGTVTGPDREICHSFMIDWTLIAPDWFFGPPDGLDTPYDEDGNGLAGCDDPACADHPFCRMSYCAAEAAAGMACVT